MFVQMEKEFPIYRWFDKRNRQDFKISLSGLNYVTFVIWNWSILRAFAIAAPFSKRSLGSPFHINWWFYS